MRNRVLIAFIFLFVHGIMGRPNVLIALKAPEGPRRKSDIPVLGNAMKSNVTRAKNIVANLLRYNPTWTTHSSFGHCLNVYLTCRRREKCAVEKTKYGYPKIQDLRTKRKCLNCEDRRKGCIQYSKRHKQQNIRDCRTKVFYCRRKCGMQYRCRTRCRSIKAQCMTEIRNPAGYFQMLKERKENKA
jgi:hypothetical protein